MQSNRHWQDQTLARFMQTTRLHLGLMQAPVAVRPPRRVAGPGRQILRSLVVAGSVGALFSGPAFASEASRQTEPAQRGQNTHSTRLNTDEPAAPAHRLALHGRQR